MNSNSFVDSSVASGNLKADVSDYFLAFLFNESSQIDSSKKQKQLREVFYNKWCSEKFHKVHWKISMSESLFDTVFLVNFAKPLRISIFVERLHTFVTMFYL